MEPIFDWLYFPVDWNVNNFGNQFAPGLYSCVMIWVILSLVCYIVLSKTQVGNWIYSTGGNLSAAQANGVPTNKVKISLFMFSAFCATLFATCQVFEVNTSDAAKGNLKELEAIAAAVIGGIVMTGGFGTILGIILAVSIVENKAMDASLMPWIIASQTIPILAIAPMIIIILNAFGLSGLLPKALISTYLSFFPIAVGMVKGLRSPELSYLDLMHTYNSSRLNIFWKLRLPSSVPYLFASMKVAIAISLVGAIVGELPTGAVAGLGARLLTGSYFGLTIQIWSALVMAAILAGTLIFILNIISRITLKRMGVQE